MCHSGTMLVRYGCTKVGSGGLSWAARSQLDPINKVAKIIKEYLCEILNEIVMKVSNGPAEGNKSQIKILKIRGRGFRNKVRFANAIYFYLGGLDLYPVVGGR